MVNIKFSDGTSINVSRETRFIGINNASTLTTWSEEQPIFNLEPSYQQTSDDGLKLSTTDERLGICGFILSHQCFALSNSLNETIYFTSSVVSITPV